MVLAAVAILVASGWSTAAATGRLASKPSADRKQGRKTSKSCRPPSLRALKRRIRGFEQRLVNALYRDKDLVEDLLLKDKIYIDRSNKRCLLESPVCLAASLQMKSYLENDPVLRRAHLWVTKKGVGNSGFRHVTLIVKDYFGPGKNLRIDPTFRQFFPEIRKSIDDRKRSRFVPRIFVGADEDAAHLFELAKPKPALRKQRWIETYLDARPVPGG